MRSKIVGLTLLVGAVGGMSACSNTSVTFFVQDGLCYRKRVEMHAGCTTDTSTVLAFQSNCHLPPNGQETRTAG